MKKEMSSSHSSPNRWRKAAWLGFICLLVGLIGLVLWPKPIEVEVVAARSAPMTVTVLEEGKTRIRHRHIISPPVGGYMNRVPLRAGDRVEAGRTVLASIQAESSGFLTPRAQAEAEARLKAAQAVALRAEAELERVTTTLDLAQKDLQRANTLRKSGAIATQEWDTAENKVQVLQRELRAATFARHVADFEVAQAKAALMQAPQPGAKESDVYEILSPINGYVLNVFEESARVVTPGLPIMEIGDPEDLEAEIELLSSDAVGVSPGAPVSIEQWGGKVPLRGVVHVVEPGGFTKISALGVEEQRVKVRVNFLDPFPDGQTMGDRFRVEARITVWQQDSVLQIPTSALFRRGNRWMVFHLVGNRVQPREVEIGRNNGEVAEVLSGLQEGDSVVLHPPDRLTENGAVRPLVR